MKEYKQAMSLRIFIDETARGDRQPLFAGKSISASPVSGDTASGLAEG